jgi:hypothetical protein
LLQWLYDRWQENGDTGVQLFNFFLDSRSIFEGELFTADDVALTALFLRDRGLIDGTGAAEKPGLLIAGINSSGIDCVENFEGSVSKYLNREQPVSYQTNFYGAVTGNQLAWGDHNQQTIEHKGFDAEGVSRLVQAIVEALPVLGLVESDATEVKNLAASARAEAEKERPDRNWVRSTLQRLSSLIGKATDVALAIVLNVLLTHAAEAIGLPSQRQGLQPEDHQSITRVR